MKKGRLAVVYLPLAKRPDRTALENRGTNPPISTSLLSGRLFWPPRSAGRTTGASCVSEERCAN
jgi:hypothetical protein